jgi:enoyl-CoA hydratase/carnithine racemase
LFTLPAIDANSLAAKRYNLYREKTILTRNIFLDSSIPNRATLVFNRPQKRNALSVEMWAAIPALIEQAVADEAVKLIFVRGSGGVFASGADISEMPMVYATGEAALLNDAKIQGAMKAIEDCPKPVIALIEGSCVGGGCGVALACDIRIGTSTSRYGITPAKLGLVYGAGDARRLVQAVGLSKAKDILFTGRLIDASEAHGIGLIDHLVAPGDLEGIANNYAEKIGAASSFSIRGQKKILAMLRAGADDAPESRALFAESFEGPDFKEGFAAFMEKRPAKFPVR